MKKRHSIDVTDTRVVYAIAGAADIDPRTVKKYAAGEQVRERLVRRIEEAIRTLETVQGVAR